MNASQYIAGLVGPLFMAVAAFMVVRREAFGQFAKAAVEDRPLIFLAGVLLLVAGVAIVQAHNLWVRDWRVVVTILGWLAVAGGLMRIFVPEFATAIVERINPNHPAVTITAAIYFAFGAFLAAKAYDLF